MIFLSANQHHYQNFDWELYLSNYQADIKLSKYTKETLWWHFLNVGEPQRYIFFDIRNKQTYLEEYRLFDPMRFVYENPDLVNQGYSTKPQLWWYYINFTKRQQQETLNRNRLFEEEILHLISQAEKSRNFIQ